MNSAVIVYEFNIASGNGDIIIAVIAHLVGTQCHSGLRHDDIAGGQHAAIFLADRNGIRLEAYFFFGVNGCSQQDEACKHNGHEPAAHKPNTRKPNERAYQPLREHSVPHEPTNHALQLTCF